MAECSIRIRPLAGYGLATIMARKGVSAAAIGSALGLEARDAAGAVSSGARRLIGTGPGTWLLMEEQAGPGWAGCIGHVLTNLASVTDQSSGYALYEVAGPSARAVLQSGLSMDMHSASFPVGASAVSLIAHIGVVLWCVEAQIFHIATFRSYATDFHRWLMRAADGIA